MFIIRLYLFDVGISLSFVSIWKKKLAIKVQNSAGCNYVTKHNFIQDLVWPGHWYKYGPGIKPKGDEPIFKSSYFYDLIIRATSFAFCVSCTIKIKKKILERKLNYTLCLFREWRVSKYCSLRLHQYYVELSTLTVRQTQPARTHFAMQFRSNTFVSIHTSKRKWVTHLFWK